MFSLIYGENRTASNDTIVCDKLKCLHVKHGRLKHYNIFERPTWIKLKVFVCSRRITRCNDFKHFFGSKSSKCKSHTDTFSKNACLSVGLTKTSVDGNLNPITPTFFSTDNKIHHKYKWLTERVTYVKNTLLSIENATTNGEIVESQHIKHISASHTSTCKYARMKSVLSGMG